LNDTAVAPWNGREPARAKHASDARTRPRALADANADVGVDTTRAASRVIDALIIFTPCTRANASLSVENARR